MTSAIPLWKLAIPRPERVPRAARSLEVTVLAPQSADTLRTIAEIAGGTAFRLTGVTPLDRGWRCRFDLAAEVGVIGDGQVFDLLRRLGEHYTWSAMDKGLVAWPSHWQRVPEGHGQRWAAE